MQIADNVIQKFIKISLAGDTLITRSIIGNDSKAWVPQLIRIEDGTFVGIGILSSNQSTENKLWVIHFESDRSIIQEKTYEVP